MGDQLEMNRKGNLKYLNVNSGKSLAVVDGNLGANHFGDNNHVAQMGLDNRRLLVGLAILLGSPELLNEAHWLALEAALEATAGTGVDKVNKL